MVSAIMKMRITVLLAAFCSVALPALHAQDDSRPARSPRTDRPARTGPAYMAALDANKDSVLDKNEIAGSTKALKKLDKDADGKLTVPELRGAPGRGPRQGDERARRPDASQRRGRQETEAAAGRRPALPRILASADANKNGALETDELTAIPAGLLKLDKNSDGQLTREEMRFGPGARARGDGERAGESDRPRRERRGQEPDSN